MAEWIITVRPPYSRWLVEGKKTMEIRTRIPKELNIDDYIYVVEGASGGNVIGCFRVIELIIAHPCFIAKPYFGKHKVPYEKFIDYVGKREQIYGILLKSMYKSASLGNIKDYGLSRAPQWFTKISD